MKSISAALKTVFRAQPMALVPRTTTGWRNMSNDLEFIVRTALIGAGGTLAMDLWAVVLKQFFGLSSLSYAMVGRWLGHMPRGRFAHESIVNATPIRGEPIVGWCAHYAIGVTFAALLLSIWGLDWARCPTLVLALVIGLGTTVAPFFIMQPCLGAGFASSKTPAPNSARLRSLMAHTIFGFGLYGSVWLSADLLRT